MTSLFFIQIYILVIQNLAKSPSFSFIRVNMTRKEGVKNSQYEKK